MLIDFVHALTYIETFVEEDCGKYGVRAKTNLLHKFILFRICEYLLDLLESKKVKLVLFFEKNFSLNFLKNQEMYIIKAIKKLQQLLGLSVIEMDVTFDEFVSKLSLPGGTGAEFRNRLRSCMNKYKKIHSMEQFYKFLSKNDIYKLQHDINNNINKKLGLFLT